MPEEIGKTLKVKERREVEVTEDATHFNVLQVVFRLPQHELEVEVCLMDAAGNAVGPARWIRLNPRLDAEGKEIDNWAQIVNMPLKEVAAKVKAALQEMTDGA